MAKSGWCLTNRHKNHEVTPCVSQYCDCKCHQNWEARALLSWPNAGTVDTTERKRRRQNL